MSDLDDKRLSNNQTRSLLTRMRVLIVTFVRIHKFDSNNLSLIIQTRAVNLTFRVKELDFHN